MHVRHLPTKRPGVVTPCVTWGRELVALRGLYPPTLKRLRANYSNNKIHAVLRDVFFKTSLHHGIATTDKIDGHLVIVPVTNLETKLIKFYFISDDI